jgi:hypothetical protein
MQRLQVRWLPTAPSLIDADDRAIAHEVIPLTCKAVVEKDCPDVQKYDGAPWPYVCGHSLAPRAS